MLDRSVSFLISIPTGALCLALIAQVFMLLNSPHPYELTSDSFIFESYIMETRPDYALGEMLEPWLVHPENENVIIIYEPYNAQSVFIHDPNGTLYPMSTLAEDETLLYDASAFSASTAGDPIYLLGRTWTLKGFYSSDSPLRRWRTGPDFVFPLVHAQYFQGRMYLSNLSEQQLNSLVSLFNDHQISPHVDTLESASGSEMIRPELISILPVLIILIYCLIITWLILLGYQRKRIIIHYRVGATLARNFLSTINRLIPAWSIGSVVGVLLLAWILGVYRMDVTLDNIFQAIVAAIAMQALLYSLLFFLRSSQFIKRGKTHGST